MKKRLSVMKDTKILMLLILFTFLSINPIIIFNRINFGMINNIQDKDADQQENLKNQGLSQLNNLSDIGEAWNITHWANRTDSDKSVTFTEGGSDIAQIPLGIGWEGYKLNTTISNLIDSRNWNNGSFSYGNDDGSAAAGEDDTDWISNMYQNWTFNINDTGLGSNPMSGNYLASIGGQDCLELRMDDDETVLPGWSTYDPDDKCWWNSSIYIPRGRILDSQLKFQIYPNHLARFNSWVFTIYLNDIKVYSVGTYTLRQFGVDSWHNFNIPQDIWINNTSVFPSTPLNDTLIDIRVALECAGGGNYSGFENDDYQRLYFDNVELITLTEALPSNLGLKLNNTIVQDVEWGKGKVEVEGLWENTNIIANFSSTDIGNLGPYEVDLICSLNLFARKHTPDTNYDTDTSDLGTAFTVSNESQVNWLFYGFIAVPTGYSESEMIIEYPTDVTISSVFEPENPLTNIISQCDTSTPGIIQIPINVITSSPDGFWKFEATSPNYCIDVNFYNNNSGSWVESYQFLSGQYLNVTAKIINTPLISSYIESTKALMQIRLTNGSLWDSQAEYINLDSNGYAKFTPVKIPSIPPDYEVGEHQVIITWNNSYSVYGFNETGLIYRTFDVVHDSQLIASPNYFEDVIDGSILNLRVSFNDLENLDAIENAIVYTYNFTNPTIIQYFSEISPGLYFLEFNVTGAPNAGNNILTIYANSSYYLNKQTEITIDIIKNTILTVDNDFFSNVPFEQNFTIQFNYTEEYSRIGISTNNISTDWTGEHHFVEIYQGEFSLTCNASGTGITPDKLYTLIINIQADNYQPQSIPIRFFITQKATFLELFINGSKTNEDELISFEFWQKINVTITYRDNLAKHLSGSTVKLVGGGLIKDLNENLSLEHYSVIFNASELGLGVDYLSIFANLTNYNSQSIRFISEITERRTNLEIYLNGLNKTLDPSIDLPFGRLLNVTVKYTSLNRDPIEDADIRLIGAVVANLSENKSLEQYSFIFNSSMLDIGVRLVTITAERENYEFQTEDLRLEIRRIYTNLTRIDGGNTITISPGSNVKLRIALNNLDFGGTIKGALVTISGRLGQGTLTDVDNDGIYEILLENIRDGTYEIKVSAFIGDDYEYEPLAITIVATRPTEQVWFILLLTILSTIGAIVIGSYLLLYQRVLKYPKQIRKVRKYRKTLHKEKNPAVSIEVRDKAFGRVYQLELDKSSKFLKGTPVDGKILREKMLGKPENQVIDKLSGKIKK